MRVRASDAADSDEVCGLSKRTGDGKEPDGVSDEQASTDGGNTAKGDVMQGDFTARGLVNGVIFGSVCWLVLILAVWAAWEGMR